MKAGSIRIEEIRENFLALMELRRVFTQVKPWLMTCVGASTGNLD